MYNLYRKEGTLDLEKYRFKRIYVEITNKCNLSCNFCKNTLRKKEEMTIEKFEHILNQIKGYTKYIYLHVKGEPLLHTNIEEIIRKAEKYGIFVVITTNATMLHEKAESLSNCKNIRQINISLHCLAENNMNKEYVDKYLYNITSATEKINKYNSCYVSYRLWNFNNDLYKEGHNHILRYLENRYKNKKLKEKIEEKSHVELKEGFYINVDNEFKWPNIKENEEYTNRTCYGLIHQIAVLVDGTVTPCCLDSEGIINLGNIFETSFSDIISTEKSKNIIKGFKNNIAVEELCKKCTFKIQKRK